MPRSLLARLMLLIGLIVTPLSVVGISVYSYLHRQHAEATLKAEAEGYLDVFDKFSRRSIAKGQQRSFQNVIDRFTEIEVIREASLYSPYGLKTYVSGQESVGIPFTKDEGQLKNPNLDHIREHGYGSRSDWHLKDRDETRRYQKGHKDRGLDCAECHYALPKDLAPDERGRSYLQGEGFVTLFQELDAEQSCATCHTNWSPGQKVGHLSLVVDTQARVEALEADRRDVIALVLLLIIPTALFFFFGVRRLVLGPLSYLQCKIGDLSEGRQDLSMRVMTTRKDEIGRLAGYVNVFINELEKLFGGVTKSNTDLNHLAKQTESTIDSLSEVINQTQTQTSEAVDTINGMNQEVERAVNVTQQISNDADSVHADSSQISDNVNSLMHEAEEMNSSVERIVESVAQLEISLRDISESSQRVARATSESDTKSQAAREKIEALDEAMGRIGNVVEIVEDITDQINLLALNATIEAASAGAAGRGFAVVAHEVDELAKKTAKATREIAAEIRTTKAMTSETVEMIGDIAGQVNSIDELTLTLASTVEEQTTVAQDISENVQRSARSVERVREGVSNVNARLGGVTQSTESVAQSVNVMLEVTTHLQDALGHIQAQIKEIDVGSGVSTENVQRMTDTFHTLVAVVGRLDEVLTTSKIKHH